MSVRLRVISPGYAGFAAQYVDSLLQLRRMCSERDVPFMWSGVQGLADIVSVRNEIARVFLESAFTHLLMVDGDIGWDSADVFKMIDRVAEFVVAAPPSRTLRLDLATRAAASGDKDSEQKAMRYFVTPLASDLASKSLTVDSSGFARIESVGGAFMLLRRSVFEKMAAAHPELRYRSAGHDVVSYFEGGIDDGERLGEDRMFCRRWRKLGGDIHLLVRAAMSHTGPYTFSGDFSRSV